MKDTTKIEWVRNSDGSRGYTFNPWVGCSKVSEGCANCYAETSMDKRFGRVRWGPNGTRKRTSDAYWKQPIKWDREAREKGVRYRVFCASLADVFEERDDLIGNRLDLIDLIRQTPNLDWLLLTKRVSFAAKWLNFLKPLPTNIWLGASVENQETANERIPHLLEYRGAVRFLSCEPLLGPINLGYYWFCPTCQEYVEDLCVTFEERHDTCGGDVYAENWLESYGVSEFQVVDWVIVGGESGHKARPMHPDWVRGIRDQCLDAGVPYFMKQWGAWAPWDDDNWSLPGGWDDIIARERATVIDGVEFLNVGKKAAGRLLDGREWNEMPSTVEVCHAS